MTRSEDIAIIRPTRAWSAITVLTIYVVVLLGIPASLRVAALGTVGAPSMILAMIAFVWWVWHHLQRTVPPRTSRAEPVRRMGLVFLLAMVLIYAHAMSRPMPGDEISPADSGLLQTIGMLGIILSANDGIDSISKWRTLLRRMAIGGGIVALLAVAQFVTKRTLVDAISIPGLTASQLDAEIGSRSGLGRPSGTATHPIEFSAVIGVLLPIAINHARVTRERRVVAWIAVTAMALASLLTVSRTAIVCVAVGLVFLLPTWSPVTRWLSLGATMSLTVVASLAVPGLNGTLRGMFLGAGEDTSVQSRTASWSIAWSYFERDPWLGRGFGTFLPKYWILDNFYLLFVIQAGIVGLLALLALLGAALFSARRAAKSFADQDDRDMAQSLCAAVAAGSVSFVFFDAFSFPQSAGFVFLVIGLSGTAYRLAVMDNPAAAPPVPPTQGNELTAITDRAEEVSRS